MDQPVRESAYSSFLPVLLVILVLLAIVGTQVYERLGQRETLSTLVADQQEPLEESRRMRDQFEGLVSGVSRLAAQDNANAQRIQADLQRVGVNVGATPGN